MNRMQVLYPRVLGGLALLWAAVLQRGALDWASDVVWGAFTVAWLLAGLALVAGRRTAIAGGAIAVLALLLFLGPGRNLADPAGLFVWFGLAVAVTDRRPLERALLVRVTVTAAYGFACLSKLNPSWLAGEQIAALSIDRSQLHPFQELFHTDVAVVIAWLTALAEGAVPLALWFRRTRVPAAAVGAVMSVVFIAVANNGTVWDIVNIIVLTGLLVAGYLAFFCPIRPPQDARGGDRPVDAAAGSST